MNRKSEKRRRLCDNVRLWRKWVRAVLFLALILLVWWYWRGNRPQLVDELYMFPSVNGAQSLSILIKTEHGELIVVDGGWEADSRYLTQKIMENGGRVAAWFLTHPHGDHAGALEKILRDKPEGITIEKIYCSLADPQWYRTYAPDDPGIADRLLERFQTLPEGMVDIQIGKGDCFRIDDVTVTVMNDRGTCRENAVNNSCIVFKLQIKKQSLLLLGDLACQGGQELLRDCGPSELRADIVQMAHHGQGGVGKTVYEAIAPEICLWPTPEWLWNNDNGNGKGSGPWSTLETRKWMEELGVKDNLCTKDGMVHMYFR